MKEKKRWKINGWISFSRKLIWVSKRVLTCLPPFLLLPRRYFFGWLRPRRMIHFPAEMAYHPSFGKNLLNTLLFRRQLTERKEEGRGVKLRGREREGEKVTGPFGSSHPTIRDLHHFQYFLTSLNSTYNLRSLLYLSNRVIYAGT